MTNDKRVAALLPYHKKVHDEMVKRRADVKEFITNTISQPVVAEEVAHFFGTNVSTARHDLKALEEAGQIGSRVETVEERRLRYGSDSVYARRSTLFYGKHGDRVPERVLRVVIDGYMAQKADRSPGAPSKEIDRKLYCQLKRKGKSGVFTAQSIADKAHLQPEAIRSRLRKMVEAKVVTVVSKGGRGSGLSKQYRVKDLEGVRKFLNQPAENVTVTKAPTPLPVRSNGAAHTPAATTTKGGTYLSAEDLARVQQVVDENAVLRNRNAELERELEELRAATASHPAVEALRGWQPTGS